MIEFKKISDAFSVAPQIHPRDVKTLAASGFKSIVVNRPDCEDAGQPSFAEVQAAAQNVGMHAIHIPIVPGQNFEKEALDYKEILINLPRPILGYCRTGARATALWNIASSI